MVHIILWMNLCKTTMKLLAAILFTTVTVAMTTQRAEEIISKMKNDLENLREMFHRVSAMNCKLDDIKGTGGAPYIRWGHNMCPSQTALIYSGYAGGSFYNHTGGAADFLCLPRNPTKSSDRKPYHYYSELWGSEYGLGSRKIHPKDDHDVPCAVCQSVHRVNSLMLPGRDVCPQGWRREYKGLLMSGRYTHKSATQYVCVDKEMKVLPGGGADKDGKLLYPVKANCRGSLKCPPYEHHQLITCAVCTK